MLLDHHPNPLHHRHPHATRHVVLAQPPINSHRQSTPWSLPQPWKDSLRNPLIQITPWNPVTHYRKELLPQEVTFWNLPLRKLIAEVLLDEVLLRQPLLQVPTVQEGLPYHWNKLIDNVLFHQNQQVQPKIADNPSLICQRSRIMKRTGILWILWKQD